MSKRRVRRAPLELVERRRRVVGDAELADQPAATLGLEPGQVPLPARRGCGSARPRRGRTIRADRPAGVAPPRDGAQIFVSTVASSRRPASAAPSARSAPPYIGEESKQRVPAASAASTTSRASFSSPSNVFHVPRPTTGPSAAPPSGEHAHCDDARRRTRRGRTQDRPRAHGPCARAAGPRTPLPSRRVGAPQSGQATTISPRHRSRHRAGCGARRRGGVRADRPRTSGRRAPAGLRAPPPRSPRPPARGRRARGACPCRRSRARRRRRPRRSPSARAQASAAAVVTQSTSPSRHGATAIAVPRSPRSLSARTVSESETGSAPPATWTYATRTPASAAHTGATWLCSVQQTTGMPVERVRRARPSSSTAPECELPGRVRERHHVRAFLGREPQPARQVRVEDVEPARPELEHARLLVDEHLVARPRPRRSAAGTRRTAIPSTSSRTSRSSRSRDRRDRAAPKAERHLGPRRPGRASRRPSRPDRRRRCAPRRCGSPPSRSRD